MIKFLDKNILFLAQMAVTELVAMAFLVGMSRLTRSYELSLVYLAIGFTITMWVTLKFFERGVGGER
jgi:hypothetical protein